MVKQARQNWLFCSVTKKCHEGNEGAAEQDSPLQWCKNYIDSLLKKVISIKVCHTVNDLEGYGEKK